MNAPVSIDVREDWDDDDSMPGSHAAFIRAVIMRAVTDVFSPGTDDTSRSEALAFLTARKGAWAESREHLCWLVDLDPDVLRERIWDILEGRQGLAIAYRGGGDVNAKYGRQFLAQERARGEAGRTDAMARAAHDRQRRQQEKAALDEERRMFAEQVKEAEISAGIRPQDRRKVVSMEFLEVDGLPLGHVLRIEKMWERSTFCTTLSVLLPHSSSAMARAVAAACSDQGFVLLHHNRYQLNALKQAADMMGVVILYQDEDGNPVMAQSEAVTARLRLLPPQPAS